MGSHRRERLQEWREKKRLSRRQCAAHLGMNEATYLRYEAGERTPSPATVRAFAATFGVNRAKARALFFAD